MKRKEKKALIGTTVYIAFTVVIFWFLKQVVGIEGEILYSTVVILPLLVYLILSEQLLSFKAGNFEATFKEAVNQKLIVKESNIEKIIEANNVEVIEKTLLAKLPGKLEEIKSKSGNKNLILTIKFGKNILINQEGISTYIKSFSAVGGFSLVCLVDESNKVVAYISKEQLQIILNNRLLGEEFINTITQGNRNRLSIFPGLITETLPENTSNIEALIIFDKLGINQMVVVNNSDVFKGVVKREEILTKLMITIANQTKN